MPVLVYVDGKLIPKEEAVVSVFDHGFLYGDGVFEGIRVYEGNVFRLKEHIDRLYESAKTIALDIPMTREEMIQATLDTARHARPPAYQSGRDCLSRSSAGRRRGLVRRGRPAL